MAGTSFRNVGVFRRRWRQYRKRAVSFKRFVFPPFFGLTIRFVFGSLLQSKLTNITLVK